jgi:hypothetical protein
MTLARSLPILAAALVLTGGAALAQDRVGVTSAVNPNATGTPPGQPTRTLVLGTDVVFNERITTEAAGQTELLFLDRSSFSIGPNSEIVIDQFVYDPAAGTGKLAASAAKGVFRFVGGALSKNPDGVTIRTPTATIGLRGGICVLSVAANGATSATFVYGREMQVTAGGVTTRATRPNSVITVAGAGQTPSPPSLAASGATGAALALLDGRPGASGGTSTPPTAQQLDRSSYPQTNSKDPQRSTKDAKQSGGTSTSSASTPPPVNVSNFTNLSDVQQVQGNQGAGEHIDFNFDFSSIDALIQESFRNFLASLGGDLTPVTSMPTTGTAAYTGAAVGSIATGSSAFAASGGFRQDWNFGTRSGSVQITNFGGVDLSGGVSALNNAPNIFSSGSSLTGNASTIPVTGALVGAFGTVAGVPAKESRGTFSFNGTGIAGGGEFHGTR